MQLSDSCAKQLLLVANEAAKMAAYMQYRARSDERRFLSSAQQDMLMMARADAKAAEKLVFLANEAIKHFNAEVG